MEQNGSGERRSEPRLRYNWPVWVSEDMAHDRVIQGQMVDLNSRSAAFTLATRDGHRWQNQRLTTRFGVPQVGPEGQFEVADLVREGHIYRVEQPNPSTWRVVINFHTPLPFRPGECGDLQDSLEQALEPALV